MYTMSLADVKNLKIPNATKNYSTFTTTYTHTSVNNGVERT